MGKILIVEDEKNISELIRDTLAIANYETECCFDGEEAVSKINNEKYDLILLDIMLPKLNGFEILDRVKSTTPVIFLSAKNDTSSIVRGLQTGIDYMTKPFEPLELLARVSLRIQKSEKIYHYKNITLDDTKKEVYKDKKKVNLAPKEYNLFLLFLKKLDTVISRDEILNEIWNINAEVETRTVDFHIGEIRKKLDLKEELITVHGIGYRLKSTHENRL